MTLLLICLEVIMEKRELFVEILSFYNTAIWWLRAENVSTQQIMYKITIYV